MRKSCVIGLAVAIVAILTGWASGNFVAYNDCVWATGQFISPNATAIRGDTAVGTGSTSGTLKDFTTGGNTSVTATLSWNSVSWDTARGTDCAAGTDAGNVFGMTTVSLAGMGAYRTTGVPSSAQVTFTGLDPSKEYEFITTANRAGGTGGTYLQRTSKFMIQDADAFANASSAGVTIGDAGASSTFVTGENTSLGYVARWTGIRCGADGDFTVWSGDATTGVIQPYVIQAFKLVEVPEPASLVLGVLGSLVLLRRR
jgi:hypothetical protein